MNQVDDSSFPFMERLMAQGSVAQFRANFQDTESFSVEDSHELRSSNVAADRFPFSTFANNMQQFADHSGHGFSVAQPAPTNSCGGVVTIPPPEGFRSRQDIEEEGEFELNFLWDDELEAQDKEEGATSGGFDPRHQVASTGATANVEKRKLIEKQEAIARPPPAAPIPTNPDDILKLVLSSGLEKTSVPNNEYGFMPIHLACKFCADNGRLIATILRANPESCRSCVRSLSKQRRTILESTQPPAAFGFRSDRPRKRYKFCNSSLPSSSSSALSTRSSSCDLASYEGSYPIHIALANQVSLDVVKLLIKKDPGVLLKGDNFGRRPLSVALQHNAPDNILMFLLSMNAKAAELPDRHMNYPLHVACMRGCSVDVVREIFKAAPSIVHSKNFDGSTPLNLAESFDACNDEVSGYLQEMAFDDDVEDIDC